MNTIKKLTENWKIVTGFITILISIFLFCHNRLNKYDNLMEVTKSTQQMSLKSVIWNDKIPLLERASACDVYLENGWNSYTKKECETILKKAEANGFFSYIERNDYNGNYLHVGNSNSSLYLRSYNQAIYRQGA